MKFGAWGIVFAFLSLGCSLEWAGAHGEITEQIKLLSQRIENAPGAKLYYRRAELFREHLDWENAEQDYRRATKLDPSSTVVKIGRAQLELDRGRAEQSLVLLKPLLEKHDKSANAHLLKARALRKLGKYSRAVASYSDAIASFNPPIADHYLERAQVIALAFPMEPKKVIGSIDEGLAKLGPLVSLQERALQQEVDANLHGEALSRLDRMLAKQPKHIPWWVQKGEVLAKLGRTDEARLAFQTASRRLEAYPLRRRKTAALTDLGQRITKGLNSNPPIQRLSKKQPPAERP